MNHNVPEYFQNSISPSISNGVALKFYKIYINTNTSSLKIIHIQWFLKDFFCKFNNKTDPIFLSTNAVHIFTYLKEYHIIKNLYHHIKFSLAYLVLKKISTSISGFFLIDFSWVC